MDRRTFAFALSGALWTRTGRGQSGAGRPNYGPSWESLKRHSVPDWYQNAKLGIFIHWGLYSVPAWAPPTGELGKVDWNTWFKNNPYAEWYLNTLRIPDSPTRKHHIQTWGENFDYYNFAKIFNEKTTKWDPTVWAKLF